MSCHNAAIMSPSLSSPNPLSPSPVKKSVRRIYLSAQWDQTRRPELINMRRTCPTYCHVTWRGKRGRGRAEAGLPAQITHTPRPPRPPPSTAVGNRSAAAAAAAVVTITSSCIQRTRNPRRGRYTFKKALKKHDNRTTISFMFARVCACLWFAFANWQNCLAWAINKPPWHKPYANFNSLMN